MAPRGEPSSKSGSRRGIFFGIGAHAIWGLVPLYFHAMADVPPWIVLCHRVVWSLGFVALLISARKEWPSIGRVLLDGRKVGLLSASACLIAINWLLFIYAISSKQALQASLGYFINPLFSVALGRIFLGEKLKKWQAVAVGIALTAVLNLAFRGAGFPWLAVSLALSFGLYGLTRKRVDIDSLHGLMIESIILFPVACAALALFANWQSSQAHLGLLSLAGIITATPLLMFGAAVRQLKLSTMGFLQYLGPTLQFSVAVLVFHEPLSRAKLFSFALCWVAVGIYALDAILPFRNAAPAAISAANPPMQIPSINQTP